MTPSTWPIFPVCPTFGITSSPDYSVTIIETAGGQRSVNRNWAYPLHTYSAIPMGDRPEEDIYRVQKFWHAVGGRAGEFLYLDYADYSTAENLSDLPTAFDQPVLHRAGSPPVWQLAKIYSDDSGLPISQTRLIQKPKSVKIAVNNVILVEDVGYTLDYDWGLVTFTSEPAPSDVVTWGGEFYVPVMFESTPEIVLSERKIRQTGFALRELRLRRP